MLGRPASRNTTRKRSSTTRKISFYILMKRRLRFALGTRETLHACTLHRSVTTVQFAISFTLPPAQHSLHVPMTSELASGFAAQPAININRKRVKVKIFIRICLSGFVHKSKIKMSKYLDGLEIKTSAKHITQQLVLLRQKKT